MNTKKSELKTTDGMCDCFAAWPEPQAGLKLPAVLLFMDAFGPRQALYEMATELAGHGYYVFLPNLFYRMKKAPVISLPFPLKMEQMPEARTQIMKLYQSYDAEKAMRDTGAFLDFLASEPQVESRVVSITGYCMGGAMAIRAAAEFPDRIRAAASFHAGMLATDAPDSPHRLLSKIKAKLYFGHADEDSSMPAEQIRRLEEALAQNHRMYESEVYAGAHHGFTMKDLPAYNPGALEKHWQKLIAFLS